MSKAPLDKATFEAIEAYVLGRMSATERDAFEQRLVLEPDLRAELELGREHIRAVELGGLTRTLRTIAEQENASGSQGGSGWGRYIAYAASIALLVSVAIWWAARPPLNERLYAAHFTPDPGLPVAMSATDDHVFADAMVYYKEGRYGEAAQRWAPLLQQDPSNDTLLYYTAMVELVNGDAGSAMARLASVSDGSSTFKSRARWYLFLIHVKRNEIEQARALQLGTDTMYGERALRILSQLGE